MLLSAKDVVRDDGGLQRFTDDAIYMPLQAATQWDAFCHTFYNGETYNGRDLDSVTARGGAAYNSITNFKDRAIGRGVLLDIPRFLGRPYLRPGESIQAGHLLECARVQDVQVGEGDFLLVRTGQLTAVREVGEWGDYAGGPAPGLGVSCADYVCANHVVAVATDTWGVEVKPYETSDIMAPLHIIFLINAGVYMGEMSGS